MGATPEDWSGVGVALPHRAGRGGGPANQDIAAELGCNPVTVGKWRTRFAAKRLDGLLDEPRPGQPRKITDEVVEQVIVATLETTRRMGRRSGRRGRWPPRSG